MKLLLDERNLIIGISNTIEYGVWGNVRDLPSWRIGANRYVMDNNYSVEDIGDTEIPTYVQEGQFYYINGEFKPAKEYPTVYDEMAAAIAEGVNEV